VTDDSDVVERLRALAVRLDPLHRDSDHVARSAVTREDYERAVDTVGDLAGWDTDLLRRATGGVFDDDEKEPRGRSVLAAAAIRAEHLREPAEVTAQRLAYVALWVEGAHIIGGEDFRASWVSHLATRHSRDPASALRLAHDEAPSLALQRGDPDALVERAQKTLAGALERLP
jgi:hypothetical protein